MTADLPERCTTCGTEIPKGRSRCPGCGRVFGEDNRCVNCNAIAAARMQGGQLVCSACGYPRDQKPGTVVLEESAVLPAGLPPGATRRAASVGLRAFGVLSLAGGVLAAMVAGILLPGAAGVIAAVLVGGLGVGAGALALRAASREAAEADARARRAREAQILSLAEKSGGRLTATEVARALHIGTDQADEALTAMADGSRVSAEVTSEGFVVYEFRELRRLVGPQVRVAEDEGTGAAPEQATEEVPAERESPGDANARSKHSRDDGPPK